MGARRTATRRDANPIAARNPRMEANARRVRHAAIPARWDALRGVARRDRGVGRRRATRLPHTCRDRRATGDLGHGAAPIARQACEDHDFSGAYGVRDANDVEAVLVAWARCVDDALLAERGLIGRRT
ncbi:MAG: hypothetical protein SangKO_059250 [Sandaracinaceae bacterium]